MHNIEDITNFVADTFDLYNCSKRDFFDMYDDEEDKIVEIPLFQNNVLDEETLTRLSIHLGMTKQEILDMNEDAAGRYWNKYPFFYLLSEYISYCEWYSHYEGERPSPAELLLNVIFTNNKGYPAKKKYSEQDIIKRLVAELKEIDKYIPGTHHVNADITKLVITTESVFSFPRCKEMVSSYLDMVDRVQQLFFKALKSELDENEINELNFLASWLRAEDLVYPGVLITYPNILMFRDIYNEENYDDFFAYVKFRRYTYGFLSARDFVPWRCKEFLEDSELIQRFVNVHPLAKESMREFYMELVNFSCEFTWSDALPIELSEEEELEYRILNNIEPGEDLHLAKERTHVYVRKNEKELGDCEEYIRNLNRVTSPVSQGGVSIPHIAQDLFDLAQSTDRLQKRFFTRKQGGK